MFGWLVRMKGRALQQQFVDLGVLQGKTRSEIEAVVGAPNAVSAAGPDTILCQWMATGYHIALLFDVDGECQGVSHESVV
jgi:hypothetical protein